MFINKYIAFSIVVLLAFSSNCFSQKSNENKYYSNDTVHWQMEIPLWVPGFRGQFAYGEASLEPAPFDDKRDFERINNKTAIEFYFGGKVSARYGNFLFQLDLFSGKIGNTLTFEPENLPNEKELVYLRIQGTIPRLYSGYSVWRKTTDNDLKIEFIPYLGVRYINVHLESDIFDNHNAIDVQPNWFEPIVGLYIPLSYKRFKLEIQSDWGGNTSKNSLFLNSNIRYRISRLVDFKLGWMLMNINHNDTFANDNLDLKIVLYGPSAGVSFIF